MRHVLLIVLAGVCLVSCGADGPPLRPGTTTPGVVLSGDARVGATF